MNVKQLKEKHQKQKEVVENILSVLPQDVDYCHISNLCGSVFLANVKTFKDYMEVVEKFGVSSNTNYYVSGDGGLAIGDNFKINGINLAVTSFVDDLEGALLEISGGECEVTERLTKPRTEKTIQCVQNGV